MIQYKGRNSDMIREGYKRLENVRVLRCKRRIAVVYNL
jgi:hypothetical protein